MLKYSLDLVDVHHPQLSSSPASGGLSGRLAMSAPTRSP
jgi:hypothetical protein